MTGETPTESEWLGWTDEYKKQVTESLRRLHNKSVISEESAAHGPVLFSE